MEDSILTSTKKILGITSDYTAFDLDILTHINSAFGTMAQLGVGPVNGFTVEDKDAVWTDFTGLNEKMLNMTKTYIYLKVRYLFDPPTTSFHLSAMKDQIAEHEWRLNEFREELIP